MPDAPSPDADLELSPLKEPEIELGHPKPGIALSLSGGGYRAMLFHVGSLWRLNELGLLPKLACIASVSGGSITAGVLGLHWNQLDFDPNGVARRFEDLVVAPLRKFAAQTIDVGSVLGGLINPFSSIADKVANAYREHLFGHKTLQDLPEQPLFFINATNVQSAARWCFSKQTMGDYRVGYADNPDVELAVAVGASSAFPPFLSPVTADLHKYTFKKGPFSDLCEPPYTTKVILSDGGVYDNLGLEATFKEYQTLLVSDAGAKTAPEPDPKMDWGRHVYRVLDLEDNQVRSLRKRILIYCFRKGWRTGAFWGIRTNILDYKLPSAMNKECPQTLTMLLAEQPTRLKQMVADVQEKLINWGYAATDAGLRTHYLKGNLSVPAFPYPERGV